MIFGSDAFMIMGAIDLNNLESARNLALNPLFMEANKAFVKSGDLLRVCLEKGFTSLTQELIEAGYALPEDILIKAIKKNHTEAIRYIIAGQFYPKIGCELEYWYLMNKGMFAYAESMRMIELDLQRFQLNEHEFDQDFDVLEAALKWSLRRGYDEFACTILKTNQSVVNAEMIEIALTKRNIDFLRRIWTGSQKDNHAFSKVKRLRISNIWQELNDKTSMEQRAEVSKFMNIGYIIKSMLERKLIQEARKVITWPDAADDKDILKVCVEMGEEEIGRDVITKRTRAVSRLDFEYCFDRGCFWLALDMLKWEDPLTYLFTKRAQEKIVELLASGSTCYFAAELLARIKPSMWNPEFTERICNYIDVTLKKNYELYKCPQPIMFLVLMAEFLLKIAPINIYHTTICRRRAEDLIIMAKAIEDSIDEENELNYFITCLDTQGRSTLAIISINNFFILLENNDVGSIVSNMWIGDRKNEGILKASTLYSSATAPAGSEEKLGFFNKMDNRRAYMFQYEQLTSSCKLRFYGQITSIAFLVFFYSTMVEVALNENTLSNFAAGENTQVLLRFSQIWIFGIFLEKFITIIFCMKTKRQIQADAWLVIDLLMFIMMIFLMAGVNEHYAGDGNLLYFISAGDFNALMHSVVLCLVWLKLFSILVVTESYGPLLRVVYLITLDMITFLLVYFGALFLGSIIMSTLFAGLTTNGKYDNLGSALTTMYSMGLSVFNLANYTEYLALGAILESLFTLVCNVLLLNVLIAILSVTYEKEMNGQEAKYRATLIKAHSRWKWDDNYGLLILMPSPITIFIITVLPILLGVKNASRVTNLFSRIFFILFVLPMFIYFSVVSALYIPIVYLTSLDSFAKGGIKRVKQRQILEENVGNDETDSDEDDDDEDDEEYDAIGEGLNKEAPKYKTFSIRRAFIWIITGAFVTILAYFRDLFHFWMMIFQSTKKNIFNQEEQEGNILSNQSFISNLQKTMRFFKEKEVGMVEALNKFIEFDTETLSSIVLSDKNLMEQRKTSIETYFSTLCYSKKNKRIRRDDILDILPEKNYYSQNYIERAKHIRIVWISKAIKTFRKKSSNVNVKGVEMPKYVMLNETFQIKRVITSSKTAKINLNIVEKNFKKLESLAQAPDP